MDELHSRWASPPQAAFCAAVNAAAGSEANDIRASPKKAMIAIVARFSDILFPRFLWLKQCHSRMHRLEKH